LSTPATSTRGDENNEDANGTVPEYFVVNLTRAGGSPTSSRCSADHQPAGRGVRDVRRARRELLPGPASPSTLEPGRRAVPHAGAPRSFYVGVRYDSRPAAPPPWRAGRSAAPGCAPAQKAYAALARRKVAVGAGTNRREALAARAAILREAGRHGKAWPYRGPHRSPLFLFIPCGALYRALAGVIHKRAALGAALTVSKFG
jgi:hypothetical protein